MSLNSFRRLSASVGLTHSSFGPVQAVPLSPSRGPDGHFRPVVQIEAIEDVFIGGWTMPVPRHPPPPPTRPDSNGGASVNLNLTPSPAFPGSTGYPFVRQPSFSMDEIPLSQLSPLERSKALNSRRTVMQPYLKFMCGPLLRYDTIDEHKVWHGAALIVSECCCFPLVSGALILPFLDTGNFNRSCRRRFVVRAVSDSQVSLGPPPLCSASWTTQRSRRRRSRHGPALVDG